MAGPRGQAALFRRVVESCGSIPYAAPLNKAQTWPRRMIARGRPSGHCRTSRPEWGGSASHERQAMNVVERAPPRATEPAPAPAEGTAAPAPEAAAPSRKLKLRPLASLLPYVKRYQGRAAAALCALVVAALATLA